MTHPTVLQIQVESSLYPSTRMAVRVPSLGFHFSPARYHRLMEIVKIFQDTDSESNSSNLAHLWDQADFEGWSSLLTWKVCLLFYIIVYSCIS
jgi:vacuolar protein sorting-associated protein 13A/C